MSNLSSLKLFEKKCLQSSDRIKRPKGVELCEFSSNQEERESKREKKEKDKKEREMKKL